MQPLTQPPMQPGISRQLGQPAQDYRNPALLSCRPEVENGVPESRHHGLLGRVRWLWSWRTSIIIILST